MICIRNTGKEPKAENKQSKEHFELHERGQTEPRDSNLNMAASDDPDSQPLKCLEVAQPSHSSKTPKTIDLKDKTMGSPAGFSKRKRGSSPFNKRSVRAKILQGDSPTPSGDRSMGKNQLLSNTDVLTQVLSFLDVKSLHKFATSSKECLKLVRPNHIVQSALYHGGHPKTNMERVLDLLRRGKILMPSPLRLLRLCNGRLCEVCQKKRVNLVSRDFGVFFCKGCLESRVSMLRRYDPDVYQHVSHLYVIPEGCHGLKVWAKPFRDSEGNFCGPKISLQCRLLGDVGDECKELALQREQDVRLRKTFLPLLEESFKVHSDPAKTRILAHRLEKFMASTAAQEKRNQRISLAIAALSKELVNMPWKEELLQHEWIEDGSKKRVLFFCPLARETLEHHLTAPSKLSKSKIRYLALQLRLRMSYFEAFQLHDFAFLLNGCAFKELCLARFSDYKLLESSWVTFSTINKLHRLCPQGRAQFLVRRLTEELVADTDSDQEDV